MQALGGFAGAFPWLSNRRELTRPTPARLEDSSCVASQQPRAQVFSPTLQYRAGMRIARNVPLWDTAVSERYLLPRTFLLK
jgi:hypothetical protein